MRRKNYLVRKICDVVQQTVAEIPMILHCIFNQQALCG